MWTLAQLWGPEGQTLSEIVIFILPINIGLIILLKGIINVYIDKYDQVSIEVHYATYFAYMEKEYVISMI